MTCHRGVRARADQVGLGLPAEQRVALGVALIETVKEPECFAIVRRAEQLVGGHAHTLLVSGDRAGAGACEIIPIAPYVHIEEPAAADSEVRQRTRLTSSALRAAEARFSDSIWGDALAGICAVVIAIALPFIIWGLQ